MAAKEDKAAEEDLVDNADIVRSRRESCSPGALILVLITLGTGSVETEREEENEVFRELGGLAEKAVFSGEVDKGDGAGGEARS